MKRVNAISAPIFWRRGVTPYSSYGAPIGGLMIAAFCPASLNAPTWKDLRCVEGVLQPGDATGSFADLKA
jgi:hypothetical protein